MEEQNKSDISQPKPEHEPEPEPEPDPEHGFRKLF